MQPLLNVQQVAEKLGVRPSTIYQWVHAEFIPHVKLRNLVRFREEDVEAWVASKTKKGRSTYRIPVDDLLSTHARKRIRK